MSDDERRTAPAHADLKSKLRVGLVSLASTSRDAAKLVAKRAEQAKIHSANLPRAYSLLGKHLYSEGNIRQDFAELYAQIDDLHAKIESIESEAIERPTEDKFVGKAKNGALVAKGIARIQMYRVSISRLGGKLGTAAYEKHGKEVGPSELVDEIERLLARCGVLRDEIDFISQTSVRTREKTVALIAFVVAGALLLLMCFGGTNTPSSVPNASSKLVTSTENSLQNLVKSYIKAEYSERYKYVHSGTNIKDQMAKHYSELPVRRAIDDVTIEDVTQVKDDKFIVTAIAKAGGNAQRVKCYIKRAADGKLLVDWQATVGLNLMTLRVFRATVPRETTIFRVIARIDDIYLDEYIDSQPTHLSIWMVNQGREWSASTHGYVRKESSLGAELYELLNDGDEHQVTVAVRCTGATANAVEIVRLISNDWFID